MLQILIASLSIWLFFISSLDAEPARTITIKIIDAKSEQPIAGASLESNIANIKLVSDDLGSCILQFSGNDTLLANISATGYFGVEVKIHASDNNITIRLNRSFLDIDRINVTASRNAESSFESSSNVSVTMQ